MGNANFHSAKKIKNDEFYTRLTDIEHEMNYYKTHFRGKTVFCNCDDPRISNFFTYFSMNFEHLGLKKLMTTCYKNQDMNNFTKFFEDEDNAPERAISLEYNGDLNGNKIPDPEEIGINQLQGDGDFRSSESLKMLEEADIVVTNPPFSLFREYVEQLVEYDKKFLVIGNFNAAAYKDIFPLIRDNKVWLGVSPRSMTFNTPNGDAVVNAAWWTNLEHGKRNQEIPLFRNYTPEEYPHYDNYSAINVDKISNIPMDYDGAMGVPVTFLDKYNPDQFEILGISKPWDQKHSKLFHSTLTTHSDPILKGKALYVRVFIRRKKD